MVEWLTMHMCLNYNNIYNSHYMYNNDNDKNNNSYNNTWF